MKSFSMCIIFLFTFLTQVGAQAYRVAVFDYDDRLDQEQTTAKYIEKQLAAQRAGIVVDQFSGKKDLPTAIRILKKIETQKYDLLITITSDALIIAHHIIKQTPTLFTNVNNPLFLGFQHLGPPGGMISGASYYISVEKQLAFYKTIMPGLEKMGFIFDLNNKSKKVELPEVRRVCQTMGMGCDIEVITRVEDLENASARLIATGVQALTIASSDMLYNNISRIITPCNTARIPVFSFNKKGVNYGALAALSSDYHLMVDELLIPMALSVLKKEKTPGDLPIAFLKENRVFINLHQAKKLDLKIPPSILKRGQVLKNKVFNDKNSLWQDH